MEILLIFLFAAAMISFVASLFVYYVVRRKALACFLVFVGAVFVVCALCGNGILAWLYGCILIAGLILLGCGIYFLNRKKACCI